MKVRSGFVSNSSSSSFIIVGWRNLDKDVTDKLISKYNLELYNGDDCSDWVGFVLFDSEYFPHYLELVAFDKEIEKYLKVKEELKKIQEEYNLSNPLVQQYIIWQR